MRVDVAVTPDGVAPAALAASAVLVVDVLRASTCIVAALDAGCEAIVPVADADAARRRRAGLPGALVAGERRGEPLAGFDLGNSPLEFTRDRVAGRTIVMTTSNGTRAIVAARPAAAVAVAAFVNAGAAAGWARRRGRDVLVMCAGERGARSLEDMVCAGLLVDRLLASGHGGETTPAAGAALALARPYGKDVARLAFDSAWARHLVGRGRGRDVEACLMIDTSTVVPVYVADVDKVVRARE